MSNRSLLTLAQIQNLFPPKSAPSERWIAEAARKYGVAQKRGRKIYVPANFIEICMSNGRRMCMNQCDMPRMPGTWTSNIGWVYFIRSPCGRYVKIGYAKNVSTRLRQLQVSHYDKLELLWAFEEGEAFEMELHEQFQAHRTNGEWFRWATEIKTFIAEKRAAQRAPCQNI